jgi:hypothetical protein
MAGCCHECGATDNHIGSQWLQMPEEQLPYNFIKHPFTCGICLWGRDGLFHSYLEYEYHMLTGHGIMMKVAR